MKRIKTFSEKLRRETEFMLKIPRGKKARATLMDRFKRSLLGEESIPDDFQSIRKITGRQKYLLRIYREYLEATQSLESIKFTLKLIVRVPRNISQLDYLRYHYEHYLNEVYIFSTRVNGLLKYLFKRCQKAKLMSEAGRIKRVQDAISSALLNYVSKRGHHVHVRRFQDKKLEQLIGLEMLSGDIEIFRHFRDLEIKKLRKRMTSEIRKNHEALENLLEKELYKYLGSIIFGILYLAQTKRRSL